MALEYLDQVNWINLTEAYLYYQKQNFQYKEVPWLVPEEIIRITFPGQYRFKTGLGDLVASGEQSFLYLELNKELIPGRYMTITPCFRDEKENQFHKKQFIKLELYITDNVNENNLYKIIDLCQKFFKTKLPNVEKINMEDGSFDLMCNGIELGSYGIRQYKTHKWIYATGVAEPRFSQVCHLQEKRY